MLKKDFFLIERCGMNLLRISFLVSILFMAGVFTCFAQEYILEIKSDHQGSSSLPATVNVDPPGESYECPFAATLTFGALTEVTLTAADFYQFVMCGIAGEGVVQYRFLRWEGDWTEDPLRKMGTIVMDRNKTITAVYEYIPLLCPSPPPYVLAGQVRIEPDTFSVEKGSAFPLEIHVNSGLQRLAAYGMTVGYNPLVIILDTSSGIKPGDDGFLAATHMEKEGKINISGFDVGGRGPGTDLHLLTTNWIAIAEGGTDVSILVDILVDESGGTIGDPVGIGGHVAVTDFQMGDCNKDKVVNIIDALLIAQSYVSLEITGFYPEYADVNLDGAVNIRDALLVAQYYVKLIPALPYVPYTGGIPENYDCFIDLDENSYEIMNPAIDIIQPPENNQAFLKISLPPLDYKKAVFEVHYKTDPAGYTLNIGDSLTNNGGGGDRSTQNGDAELEITDGTFFIFQNDYGRIIPHPFDSFATTIRAGDTVFIEIANEYAKLQYRDQEYEYNDPYLFALNGQPDNEGPVNYDIFAAFNRVIDGVSRNGTGVDFVVIRLLPE